MAARFNPSHDERTRLKIKTSQLLNRLQNFALSKLGAKGAIEMSDTQVRAALGLLKKTLPDLQSVDIGNRDGEALVVEVRRFASDQPAE